MQDCCIGACINTGVYRLQKPWLALGMRYGVANGAMVGVLYWMTPQTIIGL
jgi:hypothetical protein